jgi:hypothetical protein
MRGKTRTSAYVMVAILAIVPIWCVRYLPTGDGPSHVYNSWILHELIRGGDGPIAQTYEIDWRPFPNWIGHAAMALMMFVVPPIVAEKLFVTAIVLLFLYGLWRFAGIADDANRAAALLGVPFAYNLLFHYGFYNFCFAAGLYFVIVAAWWERRERADARTIALVAALLLLCWFAHPLPALLAAGSIALLWLVVLRGRHAAHLIALAPLVPLAVWFMRERGAHVRPGRMSAREAVAFIARMRLLYSFNERELIFGTIIFVLLVALMLATIVRQREVNAFMLLTLVLFALFAVSPSATAGGTQVQERVALFAVLSPLAWIVPPRRRWVDAVLIAVAVLWIGMTVSRYRTLGRYLTRFVHSADAIERGTTLLPILYEQAPPHTNVPIYVHAIDYVAAKKGAIDLTNYEAVSDYFPVRLRPEVARPNILQVMAKPWDIDIAWYSLHARTIFIWRMDADPALSSKLAGFYTRVGGSASGAVYRAGP